MSPESSLRGTRPAGTRDEREAARAVREMFGRIAPRYDLLNRLLSFNLDIVWRRRTARRLADRLASPNARALDVCCGTGDLTLDLARVSRGRVVGSDFVHSMLLRAGQKASSANLPGAVSWLEADALRMPFPDAGFDVVTVAFGLRNLANYRRGLEEMHRLLRPGGCAAVLEFNMPERGLFAKAFQFYFRVILPRVGGSVSGEQGPYKYLPESVGSFPGCGEFARWMEQAGFQAVTYQRWTGGTVVLYEGRKA